MYIAEASHAHASCRSTLVRDEEAQELHKLGTWLAEHHDAILRLQRDLDYLQLTDVLAGSLQRCRASLSDLRTFTSLLYVSISDP